MAVTFLAISCFVTQTGQLGFRVRMVFHTVATPRPLSQYMSHICNKCTQRRTSRRSPVRACGQNGLLPAISCFSRRRLGELGRRWGAMVALWSRTSLIRMCTCVTHMARGRAGLPDSLAGWQDAKCDFVFRCLTRRLSFRFYVVFLGLQPDYSLKKWQISVRYMVLVPGVHGVHKGLESKSRGSDGRNKSPWTFGGDFSGGHAGCHGVHACKGSGRCITHPLA